MPGRFEGWGGFAAWAGVGALLAFSLVGAASIGLFFAPAALLALVAAIGLVRRWPEMTGLPAGIGAISGLIGVLNLGNRPCPAPGSTSCGGLDPAPWFVVGAVLGALAVGLYATVKPR